jgi:3-isopropylmalate/(R)-2-methylmalate dehydratase small subunit
MQDSVRGRIAIILGNVVGSDEMVPAKYMWQLDADILAANCLTEYDPDFPHNAIAGDFIVAGEGFGFGHLHMNGLIAFKKLGIAAVIAESFSPGWYRAAISDGFPVITCPGITTKVSKRDTLEINLRTGEILDVTTSTRIKGEPLPLILKEIILAGGITAYVNLKKLALKK